MAVNWSEFSPIDDNAGQNVGGVDWSQFSPIDEKPERAGVLSTLGEVAKTVGRGLMNVPATVAATVEGSRPADSIGLADKLIEATNASNRAYENEPGVNLDQPTMIPGFTRRDIRQQAPNLGYSLGNIIPSALAGLATAPAAAVPGGQAVPWLAAGAAGYQAAKRADANMFVRDELEKYQQDYQNQYGRPPSRQEILAKQEALQPLAERHGTAEALPETLGNLAEYAIASKVPVVGKGLMGAAKNIAKGGAKVLGTELGTETVTQQLQHNIEAEANPQAGLAQRSMTRPEDWMESAGEVVKPVLFNTALLGGGYAAGRGVGQLARAAQQARNKALGVPVESPVIQPAIPESETLTPSPLPEGEGLNAAVVGDDAVYQEAEKFMTDWWNEATFRRKSQQQSKVLARAAGIDREQARQGGLLGTAFDELPPEVRHALTLARVNTASAKNGKPATVAPAGETITPIPGEQEYAIPTTGTAGEGAGGSLSGDQAITGGKRPAMGMAGRGGMGDKGERVGGTAEPGGVGEAGQREDRSESVKPGLPLSVGHEERVSEYGNEKAAPVEQKAVEPIGETAGSQGRKSQKNPQAKKLAGGANNVQATHPATADIAQKPGGVGAVAATGSQGGKESAGVEPARPSWEVPGYRTRPDAGKLVERRTVRPGLTTKQVIAKSTGIIRPQGLGWADLRKVGAWEKPKTEDRKTPGQSRVWEAPKAENRKTPGESRVWETPEAGPVQPVAGKQEALTPVPIPEGEGKEARVSPVGVASRWDEADPETRQQWARLGGWTNSKGDLTPTGKRIARQSWKEHSPAAQNVLLRNVQELTTESPKPVKEVTDHAQQERKAETIDGGGGAQSGVRQEGGGATEGGERVQPGGQEGGERQEEISTDQELDEFGKIWDALDHEQRTPIVKKYHSGRSVFRLWSSKWSEITSTGERKDLMRAYKEMTLTPATLPEGEGKKPAWQKPGFKLLPHPWTTPAFTLSQTEEQKAVAKTRAEFENAIYDGVRSAIQLLASNQISGEFTPYDRTVFETRVNKEVAQAISALWNSHNTAGMDRVTLAALNIVSAKTFDSGFMDEQWKLYQRALKKAEVEQRKSKHVASINEAIAEGFKEWDNGDERNAPLLLAFMNGFDHALNGGTLSNLPTQGEFSGFGAMAKYGYEKAINWLQTEAGQDYKVGKVKKLESVGTRLKRWRDIRQERMAQLAQEGMATDEGIRNIIAKVTADAQRGDAFPILADEKATPGTVRYIEALRNQVFPFTEWLGKKMGGGRRKYWLKYDAAIFKGLKEGSLTLEQFTKFANDYVDYLDSLARAFEGASNVDQAGLAFKHWEDAKEREMGISEYKNDRYHWFRHPTRLYQFNPASSSFKYFKENENKAIAKTQRAQLVRPKLDKIVRDGQDWRKGANVSLQDLADTFGFASVTAGDYVTAKQRQDHANYAFDAFMDLAAFLKIEPKAISLGGELHLAIGALGAGKHGAHYQDKHPTEDGQTVRVINLTNTRGDGAVAHEWFHALDYSLSGFVGGSRDSVPRPTDAYMQAFKAMLQYSLADRVSLEKRFNEFLQGTWVWSGAGKRGKVGSARYAIDRARESLLALASGRINGDRWSGDKIATQYYRDAQALDSANRKRPYWSNNLELVARAGEAWVFDELEARNDYLVTDWVEDNKTREPEYRGRPYPAGQERQAFAQLFRDWFDAIEWDKSGRPKLKADAKVTALVEEVNDRLAFLRDYEEALPKDETELLKRELEAKEKAAAEARRRAEAEADAAAEKVQAELDALKTPAITAEQIEDAKGGAKTIKEELEGMTEDDLEALLDEVFDQSAEAEQEPPRTTAELPYGQIVKTLAERIKARGFETPMDWRELFSLADEAFGGTQAQGAYTPKDAYDAVELAVNLTVADRLGLLTDTRRQLQWLERLLNHLPTQSKRTDEQQQFQQFSTPPTYGFIMGWVANIVTSDVVLEPSAGTGSLIAPMIFRAPKAVIANELSPRRAQILETMPGINRVTVENAEQIANILTDVKPTVVIMNPPFSQTAGRMGDKKEIMAGARHVEQALKLLAPGGRLVALVGRGMAPDAKTFRAWWAKIAREYRVRANIGIDGKNYSKYGTSFDTRLLVIDKTGPTSGPVVTGSVKELNELSEVLEDVRISRTQPGQSFEDQSGRTVQAETGESGVGQAKPVPGSVGPMGAGESGPVLSDNRGATGGRGGVSAPVRGTRQKPDEGDTTTHRGGRRQHGGHPGGGVGAGLSGGSGETGGGLGDVDITGGAGELNPKIAERLNANSGLAAYVKGKLYDSDIAFNWRDTYTNTVLDMIDDGIFGSVEGQELYNKAFDASWVDTQAQAYHERNSGKIQKSQAPTTTTKFGKPQKPPTSTPTNTGKSLGDILSEAADHGVTGATEALKGLYELFGGSSMKSFPAGLDEETYRKAKPHFEKAYAEFVAAGQSLGEFVAWIRDRFGPGIRPYLKQFLLDQRKKPDTQASMGDAPTATPNSVDVAANNPAELTDSVFEGYQPAVIFPLAKPHPAPLVESAAMATVEAPPITYKPNLPESLVASGKPSSAQLEAVARAGQAHERLLPNGERQGFLLGDGTGVGKGITISSIILDNWNRGRRKAVWVSKNEPLMRESKQFIGDVGLNPDNVFNLSKVGGKDSIKQKEGVLYVTYGTLIGETRPDNTEGAPVVRRRMDQIVEWLGEDFDGVLVFDECHALGNSVETRGTRGKRRASQTAITGVELQQALPKARVVYVSATAATEVTNLGYMDRLGLWGDQRTFTTKQAFISEFAGRNTSALELVANNLKAMGLYLSRSIAYSSPDPEQTVTYGMMTHSVSDEQRAMYDTFARAWQIVFKKIEEAMELTGVTATTANGQVKTQNKNAKTAAMSAFWGANQRFFNAVLTSLMVPSLVQSMRTELDNGHSILIQLVNTNAAAQEREAAKMEKEGRDLMDLDVSPKELLMGFVQKSFPIWQMEEYLDDNGNVRSRPVTDSQGNPVPNADAVRMRDALLMDLALLKAADNPIDVIINEFGVENVAEVTGRQRRRVFTESADGGREGKWEKRSLHTRKADAEAFQNGEKRILIFSDAGGTGASYHASREAKNQQRRIHYLLQPGWRADAALQGFGRSHRSFQAVAPHYVLLTTDIKGHRRFLSSVARRLDQLGALTRGQRQTTSQGIFSAEFNLENEYAASGLYHLVRDLGLSDIQSSDGVTISLDTLEDKMGLKLRDNQGNINIGSMPKITQFMNRLLALEIHEQNAVFDEFFDRLSLSIEWAKQNGTFDAGLQNVKADSVTLVRRDEVYRDDAQNLKADYLEFELKHRNKPLTFAELTQLASDGGLKIVGFGKNKRSGRMYAFAATGTRTEANTGRVIEQVRRIGAIGQDVITKDDMQNESKYEVFNTAEASKEWDKLLADIPEYKINTFHLITGTLLPIWKSIPDPSITVSRIQTDDGERFIGRDLAPSYVDRVLSELGAASRYSGMTPRAVMDQVLAGARVTLGGAARMYPSRISGEMRIEFSQRGLDKTQSDAFVRHGMIREMIQYQARHFIPNNNEGETLLGNLLARFPVLSIEQGQESEREFRGTIGPTRGGIAGLGVGTEALGRVDAALSDDEKATVANELGSGVYEAGRTRLLSLVSFYLNGVALSVSAAVKAIVQKLANGVLSVAVAFNFNIAMPLKPVQVPAAKTTVSREVAREIRRPTIDVRGHEITERAARVGNHALRTGGGKSFIVIDKQAGELWAFDAAGKLVGQSPALTGQTPGDVIPEGSNLRFAGDTNVAADKVTPAGQFTVRKERNQEYGETLTFEESPYIAIHQTYLGDPAEHRKERLVSPSADDNRISYGCVNVPKEFYFKVLSPNFESGSRIYVLPDVATPEATFGITDWRDIVTSTATETQEVFVPGWTIKPQAGAQFARNVAGREEDTREAMFSRASGVFKGMRKAEVEQGLRKEFGRAAGRWLQSGRLTVVQSVEDARAYSGSRLEENGRSLVTGFYQPGRRGQPGRVVLVADSLSPSRLRSVVLHEVFHAAMQEDPAWGKRVDRFMSALGKLRDQANDDPESVMGTWVEQAMRRVRQARVKPQHELEELAAYAISEYERSPDSLPARIRKWVRDLLAMIRVVLHKAGLIELNRITPADVAAVARAWLRQGAVSPPLSNREKSVLTPAPLPWGEGIRESAQGFSEKPFYSALTRGVEGVQQGKGTAAQWKGIIRNLPGVKPEEIEWSGVNEWLDGQAGSVSKAAVVEYVRGQEVEVREVELGDIKKAKKELDNAVKEVRDYGLQLVKKYPSTMGWKTLASKEEIEKYKRLQAYEFDLRRKMINKNTKFENYKEKYGKKWSYRELLLTLPQTGEGSFQSSHFDEPNIVAHVRFDEREDEQGRKVLHVAEVQSDWHQEGRKKGYADKTYTVVSLKKGEGILARFATMAEADAFAKQYHRETGNPLYAGPAKGVPDAPFKQSWPLLAFKRLLRYAAENGFDAVTWDTGATQVGRYEDTLRQAVDSIEWRKNLSGQLYVTADKGKAQVFSGTLDERGVFDAARPGEAVGKSVEDVFGKSIAMQILEKPAGQLTGEGLTLGGKGMEGFYDTILPNEVNKYVKKWGARVGKTTVSGQVPAWQVSITPDMRDSVMEGQPLFAKFADANLADIRYSKSQAEDDFNAMGESMRAGGAGGELGRSFVQNWRVAKGKLKRQSLGVLTPLQLVEVGERLLPGLRDFERGMHVMEKLRNQIMAGNRYGSTEFEKLGADGIAELHAQLPREVQDRLADVQHEATIYGLTPTEGFKPLVDAKEAAKQISFLRELIAQRGGQEQFAPLPGESWDQGRPSPGVRTVANLMEEERQLKRRLAFERTRAAHQARVQALYDALPDEAKRIYRLERDAHVEMSDKVETALIQLIEDSEMDRKSKNSSIARLRQDFESQRTLGDYFPLFRKGEYWAYLEGERLPSEEPQMAVEYVNAQQIKVTSRRGFPKEIRAQLKNLGGQFRKAKGQPGFFVLPASQKDRVELQLGKRLDNPGPQEGQREFVLFHTEEERRDYVKQAEAAGRTVLGTGKKLERLREVVGVSAQFVGQVEDLLSRLGTDPMVAAVQDAVWQLYLKSMPDMSARKHFIHRKKTPGYGKDSLQAFSHKLAHDAYGYARLRAGPELREVLGELEKDIGAAESPGKLEWARKRLELLHAFRREVLEREISDAEVKQRAIDYGQMTAFDKPPEVVEQEQALARQWGEYAVLVKQWGKDRAKLAAKVAEEIGRLQRRMATARKIKDEDDGLEFVANLYNEVQQAHADMMNPRSSSWVVAANQLGYVYALAFSPAAWITNALQTPAKAMPFVAARFGMGAATKAFADAYRRFVKGKFDIYPDLNAEEKEAYRIAEDTGRIDNTRVHDLWGYAEQGKGRTGWARRWAQATGFGFHQTEKMNREVTFLAAFKLARDAMEFAPAVDYALRVVDKTHLNYTAMNRARVMRGDLARMALQFKSYSQGMLYLWLRSAYSAFLDKRIPKEMRQEARRYLALQAGIQIGFAGLMGLPIGGLWVLAQAALTGDDDEPWDFEGEFRQGLADFFGVAGGRGAAKGLLNMAGPADLHSRLSERDLIWRDSDRDLEGKDALSNLIYNLAGPSVGVVGNALDGLKLMMEGEWQRGIEKTLPKFLASPLKASRYAVEGAKTMKGDTLVEDVGVSEVLSQALGFTPTRIAERYDENRATKAVETRIRERRQDLLDRAREAAMASDKEALAAVVEDIRRFNQANRDKAITRQDIAASMRAFSRNRARAVNGMILDRRMRERLDKRFEFAE